MVPFWWTRLLQDPVFQQRLRERWQSLRADEFSNATVLGKVQATADYLADNGAIERNYNRWNGITVDYEQSITDLKSYPENRLQWIDNQVSGF